MEPAITYQKNSCISAFLLNVIFLVKRFAKRDVISDFLNFFHTSFFDKDLNELTETLRFFLCAEPFATFLATFFATFFTAFFANLFSVQQTYIKSFIISLIGTFSRNTDAQVAQGAHHPFF